jgi:hypothetical protein
MADAVLVYGAPFYSPDLELCPHCHDRAVNMTRHFTRKIDGVFVVVYLCSSCGRFSRVA